MRLTGGSVRHLAFVCGGQHEAPSGSPEAAENTGRCRARREPASLRSGVAPRSLAWAGRGAGRPAWYTRDLRAATDEVRAGDLMGPQETRGPRWNVLHLQRHLPIHAPRVTLRPALGALRRTPGPACRLLHALRERGLVGGRGRATLQPRDLVPQRLTSSFSTEVGRLKLFRLRPRARAALLPDTLGQGPRRSGQRQVREVRPHRKRSLKMTRTSEVRGRHATA